MKIFSLYLMLTCLFLTSCQKEISWGDLPPGGGSTDSLPGNTSGDLLIKSVSVENGETSTTIYTYDANKQLETVNTTGTSGGLVISSYRRYYRDAAGRITRIAAKLPPQNGIEIDTIFTDVYYPDATTFNYTYTVQKISVAGFEVNDSTIFTYNSNNQLTEGYDYQTSASVIDIQESKYNYAYDAAGNVTTITGYNNASGTMQLVSTFTMEYDNKINPLGNQKQTFLISGGGKPADTRNNTTLIKFKDVSNPDEQVITISYTYGSNGFPATALSNDSTSNLTTTATFFYK